MSKRLSLWKHLRFKNVQTYSKLFNALCITLFVFPFFNRSLLADQYSVELLDENDGFDTSIVFSIAQDQQGFLWFGTAYDGLMRFDGENVITFRRDGSPRFPLKHNEYGNLLTDRHGQIWMGGWGSSLAVLDPTTNKVRYYEHNPNDQRTVGGAYIQEVFEDSQGNIWLGTRGNGLSRYVPESDQFERFSFNQPIEVSPGSGTSHRRIWAINQTDENALWVGTEFGLNKLNTKTKQFDYMLPDESIGPIGVNKIRHITPMSSQELLLGTQEGALIFDTKSNTFNPVDVELGIQLGPVFSVLKTYFGQYWLTTRRGIYYFTEQDRTLRKVPLGIDDSCALTLFQDQQNIIWMSCEGRGIYKIVPQTFFKTLDHPIASSAYSLKMSNDGNLLIGTEADGIYKWHLETNTLSLHANLDTTPQLSVNRILEDSKGDIWFSDNQSLYKFKGTRQFFKVTPPSGSPFPERFRAFSHILQARDGTIWIGTGDGVFVIEDLEKPFKYFGYDSTDESTMSSSKMAEIYEDRQGRIWLGTENGVNLWQPDSNNFQRFYTPNADKTSDDNIPVYAIYQDEKGRVWTGSAAGLHLVDEENNVLVNKGKRDFRGNVGVRMLLGDKDGNIWMITQVGVLKYNPDTDEIREFDESDGLSGARYFVNLATQSDDGTIFISSRDGIHYFNPSQIKDHQLNSQTVLTNFEVLDASSEPYTSFNFENGITLDPDENYIRFDFSTLDLLNARQINYLYKLDGLDNDWIDNGTSNTVVYTNLAGGDYVFQVRPVVKGNLLYEHELSVNLRIATPLWLQTWMLVIYALVAALIVGMLYKIRQNRHEREISRQKRFVLELETQVTEKTKEIRQESEKLAIANQVKSQFLANMSHEIRTPLTAVIGLSESIIEGDVEAAKVSAEVERIHNQSRHLLSLVNDILDVTKIEENKLELEPYELDVRALLDEINDFFAAQAKDKNLAFNIVKQLPAYYRVFADGLRLKQVLINLVSNAIKFTEKGQVTVIVSTHEDKLLVNVIDTGIGMSEEQLEKVFDVFTQGDNSINRRFGGSGLGLALSQKLVVMMGGDMRVSSELYRGSIFTFDIPVKVIDKPQTSAVASNSIEYLPDLNGNVLLAEDHPDNRRFIARLLERLGLSVTTANNGIEAIDVFRERQPDLILLDIQMPEKDGIQTYKELRALGATQPIIAVTANAMAHDVETYKTIGFNDCLTKPIVRKQLIDIISRYLNADINKENADKILKNTGFQDLKDEFIKRLEEEINALQTAHGNHKKLSELVHKLNGAARILGFKELAEYAVQLEQSIKTHPDEVPDKLNKLIVQMEALQNSR